MVRKSVLPGGIRVITEHIPHVRSVSLGFWYGVGSRDEHAGEGGISHFVEHMMFKGTKRRSARTIAEAIDASGGQLNAFTTKDHTCYYVRVLDDHLSFAIDILADMLLHSVYAKEEIEREKRVIVEEIKMYDDTPDEAVHDLFAEAVMGDHPLGRTVLGSEAIVEGLSRDDLLRFVAERYTANHLVVAAAGNVDHDRLAGEISASFAGLGPGGFVPGGEPPTPTPRCRVVSKETEQIHLVIGGPGPGQHDPAKYASFVLDVVLGGGVSSRLFQELREERGLVYETYSFQTPFKDSGLVGVYAGASPQHADELIELITAQFASLCEHGVGAEELTRAKEQLKGSLMLSLESTTNRMSRLAKSELAGEPFLSPDELIAHIDAVSQADVQALAHRLWRETPLTAAAVGPLGAPGAKEIERRLGEACGCERLSR